MLLLSTLFSCAFLLFWQYNPFRSDPTTTLAPPLVSPPTAGWRGANVLQHRSVSWQQPEAMASLQRLHAIGADTVLLVPFLHQSKATGTAIAPDSAVSDAELRTAIIAAQKLHFQVMLKPQVLVDDGWAGEISPAGEGGWRQWFARYRALIVHYAEIAEQFHLQALFVGTELLRSGDRGEWRDLIRSVRARYHGQLSYAAHDIEGVRRFRYWRELDAVSVTLYPALADDLPTMASRIRQRLSALRKATLPYPLPVWVVEYGIPSADGGAEQPWAWQRLSDPAIKVNTMVQMRVFAAWETELTRQRWIRGQAFWNWFSAPQAGGSEDKDYTIQNKPTELLIACLWNHCAI